MITQEELIDMFDYVDGKLMKNGSEFGNFNFPKENYNRKT